MGSGWALQKQDFVRQKYYVVLAFVRRKAWLRACTHRRVSWGVYLTGVHLMGLHLMGLHLMGLHLTGLHLMETHFMGNCTS
jgi:hypothetical protein